MITLTDFQVLTTGLHTGDPIKVVINFRLECESVRCFLMPWTIETYGKLDGQTSNAPDLTSTGKYGGKDNWTLTFTGKMPNHQLVGKIYFQCLNWIPTLIPIPHVTPVLDSKGVDGQNIVIDNLDDLLPPSPPPPETIEATEGQLRCTYPHTLEIFHNHAWTPKEYNSIQCGYVAYIPPETPETPEIPELPEIPGIPKPSAANTTIYILLGIIVIAILYLVIRRK